MKKRSTSGSWMLQKREWVSVYIASVVIALVLCASTPPHDFRSVRTIRGDTVAIESLGNDSAAIVVVLLSGRACRECGAWIDRWYLRQSSAAQGLVLVVLREATLSTTTRRIIARRTREILPSASAIVFDTDSAAFSWFSRFSIDQTPTIAIIDAPGQSIRLLNYDQLFDGRDSVDREKVIQEFIKGGG